MSDGPLLDVTRLELVLQQFADDRDWNQYHSPKNLAMALSAEVGELVELFQWLTEEQSRSAGNDPSLSKHVQDELADVMLFLVRLASVLKVDLDSAVRAKLEANARKYPPGDSTPSR